MGTGFPNEIMPKHAAIVECRRRFRLETLRYPVTMTDKKIRPA
jgi:hypothetical protein